MTDHEKFLEKMPDIFFSSEDGVPNLFSMRHKTQDIFLSRKEIEVIECVAVPQFVPVTTREGEEVSGVETVLLCFGQLQRERDSVRSGIEAE